jgi:hypothetical protein
MTIRAIKESTLYLTNEKISKFRAEYQQSFMFYSGEPPSFEAWVREKIEQENQKTK